jgi:hypothetical protein
VEHTSDRGFQVLLQPEVAFARVARSSDMTRLDLVLAPRQPRRYHAFDSLASH